MERRGMLDLEELQQKADVGDIETVIVAFTDHYGRLVGKRFDAEFFLESGARAGTHSCNYLLTTDMEMEPIHGYTFANWELGYGDFHLVPDLATLRDASWLNRTAIVLCDLKDEKSHHPVSIAPRSILGKQIEATEKLGFNCFAASELEYYLFNDSYRSAFEKGYQHLQPSGWYLEDYHIMQGSRVEPFMTGDVRKAIEQALERRAEREARQIAVDVRNGTVTLTGPVHSWAERKSVLAAARFTPGVRTVEDHLRTEPV